MIKLIQDKVQAMLYTVCEGDSLDSIATNFGISKERIIEDNPLFSSIYPGCVLYISGLGEQRIVVRPMQTLDDIAKIYGVDKEEIKKRNGLESDKVFVGMQIYIDKE